ncbi:MAG: hypothetical protein GOV02_00855 [Candidatus Aenigmarchaeota archaeon]|nr:hypothetical protein [Candidatus Aenigmarchaeota archaeon]
MPSKNEEFKRKRDLLNQYADQMDGNKTAAYDSTIHVDDARDSMEDYHPNRIPLGSRPDDEMVETNSGPVSIKKNQRTI